MAGAGPYSGTSSLALVAGFFMRLPSKGGVVRVTAATIGVVYGSVKLAILKTQATPQRKVPAKH